MKTKKNTTPTRASAQSAAARSRTQRRRRPASSSFKNACVCAKKCVQYICIKRARRAVRIYPEFTNFNLSKAFFKLEKNTKRVPFLNEEEKQNTQAR